MSALLSVPVDPRVLDVDGTLLLVDEVYVQIDGTGPRAQLYVWAQPEMACTQSWQGTWEQIPAVLRALITPPYRGALDALRGVSA